MRAFRRGALRHRVWPAAAAAFLMTVSAGGAPAETGGASRTATTAAGEAVASYLSGRIAQNAGDGKAAARLLTEALAHDPGNTALLKRAFLLQLAEGNTAEALTLARRAADAEAPPFAAFALLVADDLAAGRPAAARERLARAPTEGMGQYITPLLAAWTEVAAGAPDAALEKLEKLGGAPGFVALRHLQTALIEDLRGNADAAADAYARAMVGGAPLRLVQLAGNFHERRGRPEQARALYAAFARENPEHPALQDSMARLEAGGTPPRMVADARDGLAEALFDVAAALHQEAMTEPALLYARMSLHLKPLQPLARLMAGDILQARGRFEEALAEYRRVEGAVGVTWAARLRETEALRRLDRGDEAVAMLEAMAAERPDRTDALLQLGDIHRIAGRDEAAVETYGRALARLSPPERDDWVLYYARAMALEGAGRWQEAEADLRRALELNPDNSSVLNFLGYAWADRGTNLEEARTLLERANTLRPDNGHIVDSLGWAHFRQGDIEGAVAKLERAVELRPLDPTINDHLGDAYWAAGRHEEARFQWRRAAQQAEDDDTLRSNAEAKLRNGLPLPKTAGAEPATATP